MTLAADIARDWQIMDGVEDVSIRPQHPDGTPVDAIKALRRQLTHRDIAIGATLGIEPLDGVWHVWNSPAVGLPELTTVLGTPPRDLKNGDLIIQADGTVWEIKNNVFSPQCTRWRCLCVKR